MLCDATKINVFKLKKKKKTMSPLKELRVYGTVTFHQVSCDSLSLAELLPGKKRKSFFFLLDAAIGLGHEDHPLAS